MIKTNLNKFILLLLLVVAAVLQVHKWYMKGQLQSQYFDNQSRSVAVLSQINLIIADSEFTDRQSLSAFLQQINSIKELKAWQLRDENNQLLGGTPIGPGDFTNPQYFYFYRDVERLHLLTLKVALKGQKPDLPAWSLFEILLVVTLVVGVLLLLSWVFKSIIRLERYANYLLSGTDNLNLPNLGDANNPASLVINQLILKNSLLAKDKMELTEQIRKVSYVDETTELGNQMFFKAEFQVRLHNHEENESGLLMLLSFVEQDETETVVLTDARLVSIANLLRHFCADIPHALAARLRANDFALLLPNQTRSNTDKLCKTLIEQLDKAVFDKTGVKEHFVDIGISAYKRGFDYSKVLAEADMALRNSQLQGDNNWYMFGEALPAHKVRGHIRWRNLLQRVLDKRQIKLYGQTIHYFGEQQYFHQEVLARIEDGKDVLSAATFLPIANQCGLASEFDRQVVDGVIKHCLYQDNGTENVRFSINLFISSLMDEGFINWLIGKLSSYPNLSKQLIFEINESHVNKNLSALREGMMRLSEVGVGWCIEHFGSPEEDLSFLELLPISFAKIDRRIIFDIHKNKEQQLFLNTLLINLNSKNIEAFAEGVEQLADAEYIASRGIGAAQGFHFGKPTRLKRMEEFLKVT